MASVPGCDALRDGNEIKTLSAGTKGVDEETGKDDDDDDNDNDDMIGSGPDTIRAADAFSRQMKAGTVLCRDSELQAGSREMRTQNYKSTIESH